MTMEYGNGTKNERDKDCLPSYSDEQEEYDRETAKQRQVYRQDPDSDYQYERRRDMSPDERDCTYQARSWGI